jgi:hypothetical protein
VIYWHCVGFSELRPHTFSASPLLPWAWLGLWGRRTMIATPGAMSLWAGRACVLCG